MATAPAKQPKWINDPIAAAIGRIVMLEERVADLSAESEQQREHIARQDDRINRLEEQLSEMSRPDRLMTEKEVAALIRVHVATLVKWRKEKPPRIPFVLFEGGDIRYRVYVVENYLKGRERGNPLTQAAKKGSPK